MVRLVCEVPARRVADRIDPSVGGLQARPDPHAARVTLDARGRQVESVQIRPSAGRDQQIAAFKRFAALDDDLDAIAFARDALDLDASADQDALAFELGSDDGGAFGIVMSE